jgi:hypothetical protein
VSEFLGVLVEWLQDLAYALCCGSIDPQEADQYRLYRLVWAKYWTSLHLAVWQLTELKWSIYQLRSLIMIAKYALA